MTTQGSLEVFWTIATFAFVVIVSYPSFLAPYIIVSTEGILVRERNSAFVTNRFSWEDIGEFRVVSYTPVTRGLPYKRRFVGICYGPNFKGDALAKTVNRGYETLTGVDYLLPDATNAIDTTTYGHNPDELVAFLNDLREKNGKPGLTNLGSSSAIG